MRLTFDSSLLALAADFTGKFAPYQGVEIAPLRADRPEDGVTVAALDRGAIGMVGYDPDGRADCSLLLLPEPDLVKACRGIKSADRDVCVQGDDPGNLSARVTTYYKAHSTFKEFTARAADGEFPPYRQVVTSVLQRWGHRPDASSTAGRYDLSLLTKAMRAMVDDADSIVVSGYDGGPLRLQREDLHVVLLLMPQTAVPVPEAPEWLHAYSSQAA